MIDLDSPEEFLQRRMRSVDRRRLLQPRTAQQTMDFSTRIYHKLAWPILRLTFPSMALLYAGLVFFQGFVIPNLLTTSNPDDFTVQFSELMVVFMVALFIALPIIVIALGHSVGLATRVISDYVLEQKVDFDRAAAAARKGALTIIGLLMQVFLRSGIVLIVAGGLLMVSAYYEKQGMTSGIGDLASVFAILSFIVGLIMIPVVMMPLAIAPVVAVVEGSSPSRAMRRSRTLMKKARHIPSGYDTLVHLFVVSAFVGFLLWLGFYLAFEMSGLSGFLNDLAGRSVFWAIVGQTLLTLPLFAVVWILVPFMTCCITVLYYDRRVRLEALDIETMAHDVLKGSQQADLRL
ncbi:MAG: hypothetical protein WD716_10485 [Fimbriimonadaceae bacterium]